MSQELIERLKNARRTDEQYKPEIFDINDAKQAEELKKLLEKGRITVHDEIGGQLKELMKVRNPKVKLKPEEYPEIIEKHLAGREIASYGLWVYYPWLDKLVHILPKEEFIELRTAANRNKITTAERDVLSSKKVGVIGLSVGQSVALTIALERGCGELRLADFDTLELNNLNRIRTGVQNLGVRKVYAVAREIAEIDPFLTTICYTEGITEGNINDFFLKGGKLDAVIDECDGVDVKILCRIKAKELHVPVIMEASDRGTLDVERFDLHPDRPIMHGWLEHLTIDFEVLKKLKTSEEKLPYILPISGLETLSPRMKGSMIEIEETITTWPQLASAVALGGAVTADTCRRIFLGQFTDSNRYFIDLEQLIKEPETVTEPHELTFEDGISEAEMMQLIAEQNLQHDGKQIMLTNDVVEQLVGAAITAPTGGNAQPWKWKYYEGVLYLFANHEYHTRLVDFNNTASYIGYGAASENLVLKAHDMGYDVQLQKMGGQSGNLMATYRFYEKGKGVNLVEPHVVDYLSSSIQNRYANRLVVERKAIGEEKLQKLVTAAQSVGGAKLHLLTDEKDIADIAEVIASADRLRILHEGGHLDFLAEMVWTDEEAKKIKKGVDIETLDITASEKIGFKMLQDYRVIKQLNNWKGGKGLGKVTYKSAASASAIGLITMPSYSIDNFFDGGRAVERVWLAAAHEGIAFQPLSISTFLFNRLKYEGDRLFTEDMAAELAEMRGEAERLFSLDKESVDILMFRLFLTDRVPKRSERVPVQEVLSF
jgi:Dinucleotide-utilizing enzymes involved in molybdopterin and thiamine biosynthesis family 1